MVTETVDTTRCELCGTALETRVDGGHGPTTFAFTSHTQDFCRMATLARIAAMQAVAMDYMNRQRTDEESLAELGRWVSSLTRIVDSGSKWLELRAQRQSSRDKIRESIGTPGQAFEHPLWVAEGEVAAAIQQAISQVEIKRKRAQ